MQNHRVTHKEARVHQQQILQPGQEAVDNKEVVVNQEVVLEDSQVDEMRTEEEDKDCREI